jgi:methylated-DNA-[protein]-cysteine S-methyltransferase
MNITSHTDQIEGLLRGSHEIDAERWRHLRAQLGRRAEAEGLLDVAFERHDSPLGSIVLAATRDGLVRVGLPAEGEDAVLEELARRISCRVLCAPRDAITTAHHQLDEYFGHQRTRFELPLDWRLSTGFRRQVLTAATEIPYGQTASYRDVATRAGSPKAVRAAGSALARNPLPIVVPCHRVVRTGGQLGAYRGGPAAKATLVELERSAR